MGLSVPCLNYLDSLKDLSVADPGAVLLPHKVRPGLNQQLREGVQEREA